jgi:hypothetical protein
LRQFNLDNEFNIEKRDAGEAAGVSNPKELHAFGALPSPELQQAIRDDYRLGRVETVQGWIVAKTEAELIRACPQLSRMIAATNWTAARKF